MAALVEGPSGQAIPLADQWIDCCNKYKLARLATARMFGVMSTDRSKLAQDYSLIITSMDRLKGPWGWQIQRKSKPLGIKNYRNDFKTQDAARIAGEKTLKEFLDGLCREENGAS